MKPCLKSKPADFSTRATNHEPTVQEILEAIDCITTVPREAIEVTVHHGWVRLEGVLLAWGQKEMVDHIVRNVPGVKGLISLIRVEPFQTQRRTLV
jgi:osmotically-inducible protein OsmY